MNYKEVQLIGKQTIEFIKGAIRPGMKLEEVRRQCEEKMLELGADSFWYWDIRAFIFSGDETAISISGKNYKTADKVIQKNDIVTIDLSPQWKNIWGDYARTIIIEDGKVVNEIDSIRNKEWQEGLLMEQKLHRELSDYINENTTFEDLFYHMNAMIISEGFINLDFLGNLGHSIEKKSDDRIYIEKGNKNKLSDIAYFTFEPHISKPGSVYGYKMENIYYFENGLLKML